jgi:hypothetical protein
MTLQALGGGEFALRLVPRQRAAPLYWRTSSHTHPDAEHLWEQFHNMLHALPVDKWDVFFAYHPSSVIKCLRHLFSPELSDHIIWGPRNPFPGNLYTDFFQQKVT